MMENNRKTDDQKETPEQDDSSFERRKGLDRRWIKSDHSRPERRNSKDRRRKKPQKNGDFDPTRL
jgi:hypothetical protein